MQSLYDRKCALVLYLIERQKRLAGDVHTYIKDIPAQVFFCESFETLPVL